jgi:DNA-binding NtrC family response regulator
MSRILVVDDDGFFRKVITKLLTGHGHEISPAASGEEALETLTSQTFDLMISDVNMTPMNGMELLEKAVRFCPEMGVIMLTGHDEIEVAIEAMKKGAFDFLVKPFQMDDLFATVQRSLEYYNVSPENKPLRTRLDGLEGLVAESGLMRKVCDMIRRVAPANVTVLLSGEPGTEKEMVARALHYYSARKDEPFVMFDCSMLPVERIESELPGPDGGTSKTLADVFQAAKGGTVFLDNIEDVPLDLQAKLLSFIQSGRLFTTGGDVDVRLVVASDKNLEELVAAKAFNENLYYRLSALQIDIPPLNRRPEDIPYLIDQALRRDLKEGEAVPVPDASTRDILYGYIWPGNVGELEAAVRHARALAENGIITRDMLPASVVEAFEEGIRSDVIIRRRDQIKGQAFKAFLREKQEKLLNRNEAPAGDLSAAPSGKDALSSRIKE